MEATENKKEATQNTQGSQQDKITENEWIVEGFTFYTEKDAALAIQEQKKIEYLEERMNYSNPANVLVIYEKAIRERVFKTPIGILYLKKIQHYLLKQPGMNTEKITPIPLYLPYDGEVREQAAPARRRIQPSKKKPKKSMALPVSVILNITLIIGILAMFIITLSASQPNILNYERVLKDRYAGWEQELTEREQAVREKERVLQMEEW